MTCYRNAVIYNLNFAWFVLFSLRSFTVYFRSIYSPAKTFSYKNKLWRSRGEYVWHLLFQLSLKGEGLKNIFWGHSAESFFDDQMFQRMINFFHFLRSVIHNMFDMCSLISSYCSLVLAWNILIIFTSVMSIFSCVLINWTWVVSKPCHGQTKVSETNLTLWSALQARSCHFYTIYNLSSYKVKY